MHIAKNIIQTLALAVIVTACTTQAGSLNKESRTAANPNPGIPVDALVVQPGNIADELDITGTLIANQRVDIVSELTRRLVHVNVKEGTHVKQGTLLFKLDDADLLAQLERFHQQAKLAKLNEERLKDLLAHDAIAQQDYDEASTNLKVLEAQILELEVMISKTRITAPFDGQIGMINIHQGAIVSVNTLLTNIEDNNTIKVEFSIPEKYTNVIQLGSKQTFTIPSDEKIHSATVIARGASLSQNTRTLLVRATTPNADGRLLPGQSARINVSLSSSSDALAIPSQSLIPSSRGYSVLVARNNKVVPAVVEIGQRGSGMIEITKGLSKGDTLITSNLMRLTPGAAVYFATIK
ncbi:MAG: efflux RND transporter periplasmic adaptor subunit [Bacteroidota bacterium]